MRQLRVAWLARSKMRTMGSDTSGSPRISLVIPAYNEAGFLPRLLDTVAMARGRYDAGPSAVEVIVADNMSTDGTAAMAQSRGCRVATVERRGLLRRAMAVRRLRAAKSSR